MVPKIFGCTINEPVRDSDDLAFEKMTRRGKHTRRIGRRNSAGDSVSHYDQVMALIENYIALKSAEKN